MWNDTNKRAASNTDFHLAPDLLSARVTRLQTHQLSEWFFPGPMLAKGKISMATHWLCQTVGGWVPTGYWLQRRVMWLLTACVSILVNQMQENFYTLLFECFSILLTHSANSQGNTDHELIVVMHL